MSTSTGGVRIEADIKQAGDESRRKRRQIKDLWSSSTLTASGDIASVRVNQPFVFVLAVTNGGVRPSELPTVSDKEMDEILSDPEAVKAMREAREAGRGQPGGPGV